MIPQLQIVRYACKMYQEEENKKNHMEQLISPII